MRIHLSTMNRTGAFPSNTLNTDYPNTVREIQKRPIFLRDITNQNPRIVKKRALEKTVLNKIKQENESVNNPFMTRVYKEDMVAYQRLPILKTSNYRIVNLKCRKSQRCTQFVCYKDSELKVMNHFQSTIPHTCDNDVSTDEEQIKGAIKNIYRNIRRSMSEY